MSLLKAEEINQKLRDFEVTSAELDVAVEAALEAGALGARASDGAVVVLIPGDRVPAVRELVGQRFDGVGWPRPGVVDMRAVWPT